MNVRTMYGKCLRKRAYRNLEIAERECKKTSEKYGVEFHIYWCKLCGMYHLTKQPRNKKLDKLNIR